VPRPAATLLLLRDGAGGLEVLMIERHRDAFFPGALVFPGGTVDEADRRPGDPPDLPFRRAAIRETFEEVGITVAAPDLLVPFARWITPERSPRRWDTYFFLARAPEGQTHRHDGHEAVDAFWTAPQAVLADPARRLVFATRVNLMRLARSPDVAAALAAAEAARPLLTPVCPEVYDTPEGSRIRIPAIGGYDACDLPTPAQRHG
jgi:8-oxo-dGTP pyrophosphatase MutT (NUDIX family)